MRKLIFNSILKDYKDSLPTIVIISFMICVVFSSLTAQYSQSSYVKKIIENNTTKAQAEFFDVNKSQLKLIKDEKSIKSMSITKSYGNAYIKNRISENILEFNEEYFENFNLRLEDGRMPINQNEIILEKSILQKYNIKLNEVINIRGNKIIESKEGKKEYVNYSINSKVVGDYVYPSIIENLYKYQDIFISSNNEFNKIINNENLSYNGTIIYKPGVNPISKSAELSYNINSSSDHIVPNSMYNDLNEQIATSSTFTNTDKVTILIAGIIILNISILNSIEASRRQGLIRLLGCSKKKTILIEILKSLIVYLVSCFLAYIVSIFMSKILINEFDFTGSLINSRKANLLLDIKLFIKVISPLFIIYLATTIYSCKGIFSKTPIEQYNISKDYSSRFIKKFNIKKLENKILINNILSEKLFVISNTIILAFSGYMYLVNYYNNNVPAGVTNNELAFYEKVDLNIYRDLNVKKDIVALEECKINNLSSLNGIKEIYKVQHEDGYEYLNTSQLTTKYKQQQMIKDNETKGLRFNVLSFDNNAMGKFLVDNKFIKDNIKIKSGNDIPNVLIYNQFYSIIDHKNQDVIKGLKQGDIIEVSLPYYEKNGDMKFKDHKVKIAGFLSKQWYIYSNTEQTIPDIIFSDTDFDKLVGRNTTDNIYISLSNKKSVDTVKSEIEKKIGNRNPYMGIKTQSEAFNEANKLVDSFKVRKITISYFLLLMSSVNIIIGLIVSFIRNYNVYSIFNALGGKRKKIKKIYIYEILVLTIPGVLVGILYSTFDAFRFYKFWKDRAILKGLNTSMSFMVPSKNIILYVMLVIFSGIIAYSFINKIINSIKVK